MLPQVAPHFAATHPALDERLVLSCPSVPRAGTSDAIDACEFLSYQTRTIGPFNMAGPTAMKQLAPSRPQLAYALVQAAFQLSSVEGYVRNCELIRDSPAPDWKAIVAPVLIIVGTEDVMSSVVVAEEVKGARSVSQMHMLHCFGEPYVQH